MQVQPAARLSLYLVPLDRFGYFAATDDAATLTTYPLVVPRHDSVFFELNVDTSAPDSDVAVEVLEAVADGSAVAWRPVERLGRIDVGTTDAIAHCVVWRAPLAQHAGRAVRMRFTLRGGARLYAFRFAATCEHKLVPD